MGTRQFLTSSTPLLHEARPWARPAAACVLLLVMAALLPPHIGLVSAVAAGVALLAALNAHEARDDEESLRALARRTGLLSAVALASLLFASWEVHSLGGRLAWLAAAAALGTAAAIVPLDYQRLERWYVVPMSLAMLLVAALVMSAARAVGIMLG